MGLFDKILKKSNFHIHSSNVFLIFTLIYFGIIVFSALTKPFIGYDDYYTLAIVKLSFNEMINTIAKNVHPPLYYLILKLVLKIYIFYLI